MDEKTADALVANIVRAALCAADPKLLDDLVGPPDPEQVLDLLDRHPECAPAFFREVDIAYYTLEYLRRPGAITRVRTPGESSTVLNEALEWAQAMVALQAQVRE